MKNTYKKPFLGLTHLAFPRPLLSPRPLRETKRTGERFEACEPVGAGTSERAAFTLAEVLITLGIIGTVAAMTIPTVISNIDKRDRYSGLLKGMSVISQASDRIRMENGNSMAGLATYNTTFMNLFVTYLKPVKICNANDYSCYLKSTDTVHELKGGTYADNTNILCSVSYILMISRSLSGSEEPVTAMEVQPLEYSCTILHNGIYTLVGLL